MADEKNIGASRSVGSFTAQQAVDSLENVAKKLTIDFSNLSSSIKNLTGSANRAGGSMGGNTSSSRWNIGSNRNNYSANGGGGNFGGIISGGAGRQGGGRGNGGMPGFSSTSRFAGVAGAVFGVGSALADYGNRNMSSNMQMNMFGNLMTQTGGIGNGGVGQSTNAAMRAAFTNNFVALNASDAARAGYINSYVSGYSAQSFGGPNPAFSAYNRQVQGFGYLSPTQGASGAAQAGMDIYTARSTMMMQGLGIGPTIRAGGIQTPMGQIAQSIMRRSLRAGQSYNQSNIAAALSQNGGLTANLNFYAQQAGWSQGTVTEMRNYMQGLVAAQARGISASQFDTLTQQAAAGDRNAQNRLKAAGIGGTMFESQRNLNASRLNRQEDILESLAPAFNDATSAVQKFSDALTAFLKNTGLDKAIGTGAGWSSAISGGLSGFSGAFGAGAGIFSAMRMFGGGRGGFSGLGGLFRGGGGGGAGGLLNASRGANGIYNITSLGGEASTGGSLAGGGIIGAAGILSALAGYAGWNSATNDGKGIGGFLSKNAAAFSIFGAAANVGQGFHRLYDKFITGKDKESIWNLLTPGGERRSTPSTGINGGNSNSNSSGGGQLSNGSSNIGASAAQILKYAESQLGVPYVWGGESPGKAMDCSGLTQWAYAQAGVSIPRVAQDQQNAGTPVPVNATQPGDLLFIGKPAHHVVMNAGNGQIIEAPHTGANVRMRALNPSEYTSATRIVGAIGDMSSLLNNNTAQGTNGLNKQQSKSGGNVGAYGGTSEAEAIASALAGSAASMPINSGSQSAGSTSGNGATGNPPTANGRNDKTSLQAFAKQLLASRGWSGQWDSFNALVNSESSWDYQAKNPSSGAYGIAQALPASKYASAGSDWMTNGDTQLSWMMGYIADRYGNPDKAWSFHQKNNWYANGAWSIDKDQTATVHQGEMIIPAKQAETIRQTLLNNTFNPNLQKSPNSGGGLYIGTINVRMPDSYSGSQSDAQATGKAIADAIAQNVRIQNLQIGQ